MCLLWVWLQRKVPESYFYSSHFSQSFIFISVLKLFLSIDRTCINSTLDSDLFVFVVCQINIPNICSVQL